VPFEVRLLLFPPFVPMLADEPSATLCCFVSQMSPLPSRSASQKSEHPEESEEIKADKLKAKELLKRAHEAKVEIDEAKRKLQEELQEVENSRGEVAELRREAEDLKFKAQKEVWICLFVCLFVCPAPG